MKTLLSKATAGDKFLTRDGRIAILLERSKSGLLHFDIEGGKSWHYATGRWKHPPRKSSRDIIAEYENNSTIKT